MTAPKKPDEESRATVDDIEDPLDLVLGDLADRGLLLKEEQDGQSMPVLPPAAPISRRHMEAGLAEVSAVLFSGMLRDAKTPGRDEWFGSWLKSVRSRSQLTIEEVAGCCCLRAAEWQLLEEKPVQVVATYFNEHVLAAILRLFDHPLSQAAQQMARGLDRPASAGPIMRRTTGTQYASLMSAPLLRQPKTGAKAQERLDMLVERTRALLLAEGRDDLT